MHPQVCEEVANTSGSSGVTPLAQALSLPANWESTAKVEGKPALSSPGLTRRSALARGDSANKQDAQDLRLAAQDLRLAAEEAARNASDSAAKTS